MWLVKRKISKEAKWVQVFTTKNNCNRSRSLELAKAVCELDPCFEHFNNGKTWCGIFSKCQAKCEKESKNLWDKMNIHEEFYSVNLYNEWKTIARVNPYGCIECDDPSETTCRLYYCVNGEKSYSSYSQDSCEGEKRRNNS